MQTKYILLQKNTLCLIESQKTTDFSFSDLINEENKSKYTYEFEFNQHNLPQIIENFITKCKESLKNTNALYLLLDYPWTRLTFLNAPTLKQSKLKKIIPFEVSKKLWKDNQKSIHSFYFVKNKKKILVVIYTIEFYILKSIQDIFLKANLKLPIIEPYTHWLQQEIYLLNKKITNSIVLTFSTFYANLFVFDEIGFNSFYSLPIQKKVDTNFWKSFLSLIKRINLLSNKSFNVLIEEDSEFPKKRYLSLDLKQKIEFFPSKNIFKQNLPFDKLKLIDNHLTETKNRLNFNYLKIQWSFSNLSQNLKFYLDKYNLTKHIPYLKTVATFFSIFGKKIKLGILASVFTILLLSIVFLKYQQLEKEYKILEKQYNQYLKIYQIESTNINLVRVILNQKIKDFQNSSKIQKKYLQKKYTTSEAMLKLTKIKKKFPDFKIIKITLEQKNLEFTSEIKPENSQKLKNSISKQFKLLENSLVNKKENILLFKVML